MIEPLLVITLAAQYVLLALVFHRECSWVYMSHLLVSTIPPMLYWLTDRCPYPPALACYSPLPEATKLFLLALNAPTPLLIFATVKRRKIAAAYLALVLTYVYVIVDTLRCIDLLVEMCREVAKTD